MRIRLPRTRGAGGVAGADANADTPRYTNQDNTQAIADSYSNSSATREWLYNSVKEQRQVDPGVLENATVGIVINTDDTTTVTNNQLINLVADSAGIPRDLANQSITIVRAPSQEAVPVITPPEQPQTKDDGLPLPYRDSHDSGRNPDSPAPFTAAYGEEAQAQEGGRVCGLTQYVRCGGRSQGA